MTVNEDMKPLMCDWHRAGYQQAVCDIRTAIANRQDQLASIMIERTDLDTPSDSKLKAKVDELSTVLSIIDQLATAKRDADDY